MQKMQKMQNLKRCQAETSLAIENRHSRLSSTINYEQFKRSEKFPRFLKFGVNHILHHQKTAKFAAFPVRKNNAQSSLSKVF